VEREDEFDVVEPPERAPVVEDDDDESLDLDTVTRHGPYSDDDMCVFRLPSQLFTGSVRRGSAAAPRPSRVTDGLTPATRRERERAGLPPRLCQTSVGSL
jgi:hypothetical protein